MKVRDNRMNDKRERTVMKYYIVVDLGASNGRVMVANYENKKFEFVIREDKLKC